MSEQDWENLPSITTRENDDGGQRSSAITEKDTAVFAREVDGVIDLTRPEKDKLNKIDLESKIEKEKIVLKKIKDIKVKKMYTCYQNLWTAFVANNNIVNEHDDVALVRFFQSIQGRYSPNSRFTNTMECLPSLHKYLEQQMQIKKQ